MSAPGCETQAEVFALNSMGQALIALQSDVSRERKSREKSLAITKLEEAIMWLEKADLSLVPPAAGPNTAGECPKAV